MSDRARKQESKFAWFLKTPSGKTFAAVLFGAAGLQFAWGLAHPEPKKPDAVEVQAKKFGHKSDAYWAAKHFTTKRLKSPSSAKFFKQSESTIEHLGKGRWRVMSAVTAENALGGHVQTPFDCVLQFGGKSPADFSLVSLKM